MAETATAKVTKWASATRERMVAVRNEAAQRLVEEMQTPVGEGGNMPVDTGFLRASLVGTANAAVPVTYNPGGSIHTWSPEEFALSLLAWDLNTSFHATYTANYAAAVNYGARGHPGRQFVGLAVQRWPQIVADVAAQARRRSLDSSAPANPSPRR